MMLKKAVFFATLMASISSAAWAADCASVKASAERLKCYDASSKAAAAKPTDAAIDSPVVVKMVDPSDLFVGTKKYLDREIGLRRIRCYYADVSDYRCTAPNAAVSVFSKSVAPKAAKDWIDQHCDTVKKAMTSSKCLMTIHFKYGADDVGTDLVSGFRQRMVIKPPGGIEVFSEKAAERRRR